MRENTYQSINSPVRDDFILRSLAINDVIQCPEKLPNRMRTAISNKNFITSQDIAVYELIEKCEQTVKIPWRHIITDFKD